MGSNTGAIGNKAGVKFLLAANTTYFFTSYYSHGTDANWFYVPWPHGWTKFTFQFVPGDATTGEILINGTMDQASAENADSNLEAFEPIPAPSSEAAYSWFNPLTTGVGQRLMYVNAGPICAFSAVVNAAYDGTTGYLLFGATS